MTHASRVGHSHSGARRRYLTQFAAAARAFAKCITFACLGACAGSSFCLAAGLTVTVLDRSGHALPEVVATAAPTPEVHSAPAASHATAIMDQRDIAFVPQVLVVGVGTNVEFPNNDTVSHQVYSFSPAKRFQLPLYKGALHPPVIFDKAGLVVLGCNIHDQMVGYIYVTDAPYYGKTDAQGTVHLPSSPGDYLLTLWSPYIADPAATLTQTVHVGTAEDSSMKIQLTRDLRARPEPRPRRADWEY
jgi:plastocyanin